jgi:hypothetical protein
VTNAEVLAMTIERCDALLEEQLEAAEILLIDLGADAEEVKLAIGPHGYHRRALQASRDEQIDAVVQWLAGTDGTRH